jgi:exopolysaccharide production protein ExoQ
MTEALDYLRAAPAPPPPAHPAATGKARAAAIRFIDPDGLFTFALFAPMLFAGQLGAVGAALIVAAVVLYTAFRARMLPDLLLSRALLLVFPAYAVFSVVWSEAPFATLKYAVEFCITVLGGLMLTAAPRQRSVLMGMLAAFLLFGLVSLAFGGTVGVGNSGAHAFSGLSASKNLLADIASTGALVAVAVLVAAAHKRNMFWAVVAVLAAALEVYLVLAARSAGAVMGLAMGVLALSLLLTLRVSGQAVRGFLTALLAVLVVAMALSYRWLTAAVIDAGTAMFDKDPTLTGRTYLWYRASDLVAEKPLLGRGYSAFWIQGNTDAEGLWRYAGIAERGGFTFHNIGVEVLVHLGWVGLALFALTLIAGVLMLIWTFVVRPNLTLCFWVSILLYEMVRMPIESVGMAPFHFSTLLVFGALGAAFAPWRRTQPSVVAVQTLPPSWPGVPPAELLGGRAASSTSQP